MLALLLCKSPGKFALGMLVGLAKSHLCMFNPIRKARISEECAGNMAKIRLLVNPYGPEIQTELC